MKQAICVDVDDVLLSWFSAFNKWMKDHGFIQIREKPTGWALENMWRGMDAQQIDYLIELFARSPSFETLFPVKGAPEGMRELQRRLPDHEVILVSACGVHPLTIERRIRNLQGSYRFDKFIPLPLGSTKKGVFAELPPNSIIIEDSASQALEALELDKYLQVIMLTTPGNYAFRSDSPYFTRVAAWSDIPQLFPEPEPDPEKESEPEPKLEVLDVA